MTPGGVEPEWTIGDRLRKAREHAGLKQQQLAALTGISDRTITHYERGKTKPRRHQLIAWALATGVSLEWLLGDAGGPGGGIVDEACPPRDSNPQPADSRIVRLTSVLRAVA